MTPAEVRADYREAMLDVGWTVQLRRQNPSGPPTEIDVLARIVGFKPDDMGNGIQVGDSVAIILAEDVDGTAFTLPFRTGGTDAVIDGGRVLNIQSVDVQTRRLRGVDVAYEVIVGG